MPKVYRTMKKDNDELPTVEASAKGLGVRSNTLSYVPVGNEGIDIRYDDRGNVHPKSGGMSVSPHWMQMPPHLVPERLRCPDVPGARARDSVFVWSSGSGDFIEAAFAPGLTLVPDRERHGAIEPSTTVKLEDYEKALSDTRDTWSIDEVAK